MMPIHSFICVPLLLLRCWLSADDGAVAEEEQKECCRHHTVKLLHRAKMMRPMKTISGLSTIEMYIKSESEIILKFGKKKLNEEKIESKHGL